MHIIWCDLVVTLVGFGSERDNERELKGQPIPSLLDLNYTPP